MTNLIILDVDPGLDDLRGLLYVLNCKKNKIIAITTCSGNVFSPITAYNTGLTLGICKRSDIPVYEGTPENISGELIEGNKYYGANGVGDLKIPYYKYNINKTTPSHLALLEYAQKFPKQIILCCCGPLTNLARAYQHNNKITNQFKHIFIIGGDRSNEKNFHYKNHKEFNFNYDPVSAEIVLKNFGKISQTPIYLFDATLCNRYRIPGSYYNSIADILLKNPDRIYEAAILRARSEAFYQRAPDDTIFVNDELLILCACNINLITKSHTIKLEYIEKSGEKRGETKFSDEKSEIHLVDDVNFEKWKKIFYDTLLKHSK